MSGARRRSLQQVVALRAVTPGGGFDRAVSLNRSVVDGDISPFVDLTLFDMSEPVFRPHPHAGFSAVTYMLESSEGAFRNRWTGGPDELIGPGAIHWTRAGKGMMHEEVPTAPGTTCRGVQMFVKLPVDRELDDPRAFHLDPSDIPEVRPGPGARVRVLAGELGGTTSPLGLPDALTFLDVHLAEGGEVEIPAPSGWNAFVFVLAGTLDAGSTAVAAHGAATFADDGDVVHLSAATATNLLLCAGPPTGPFVARGPFLMSSAELLDAAQRRFANGEMGHLTPSF